MTKTAALAGGGGLPTEGEVTPEKKKMRCVDGLCSWLPTTVSWNEIVAVPVRWSPARSGYLQYSAGPWRCLAPACR